MTEPTGVGAFEVVELLEEEARRQEPNRDAEKVSSSGQTSQPPEGDSLSDPLARLPTQYRKEIEAQVELKSRRVSFNVCFFRF